VAQAVQRFGEEGQLAQLGMEHVVEVGVQIPMADNTELALQVTQTWAMVWVQTAQLVSVQALVVAMQVPVVVRTKLAPQEVQTEGELEQVTQLATVQGLAVQTPLVLERKKLDLQVTQY
jgi:hypothetical protein